MAGEAAIQEAQEDVGPDLGDRAGVACAAQVLGRFVDPGAGDGRLLGGEAGGADDGGAVGGQVADHLAGGDWASVAAGDGFGIEASSARVSGGGVGRR